MPSAAVKRTYIGFILDKSGSMQDIWEKTIAGFNAQIKAICEEVVPSHETYVSFTVFDGEVKPVYFGKTVNYLTEVAAEDYEAKGSTALYDAIGAMVHSMGEISEEADPANSYVVHILSDGKDKCSKKYTQKQAGELIKAKQETKKWTFTFMGCDQNLFNVSQTLNIPMGNIANFDKSAGGVAYASEQSASQMKKYLKARNSGEESSVSFHSADGTIADYSIAPKLSENIDQLKTFPTGVNGYLPKKKKK